MLVVVAPRAVESCRFAMSVTGESPTFTDIAVPEDGHVTWNERLELAVHKFEKQKLHIRLLDTTTNGRGTEIAKKGQRLLAERRERGR